MRLLRIEEEDEKRKAQVEFEERRAKVVERATSWFCSYFVAERLACSD